MKSLLFNAILSLRKRSEQILIKFAILLQVRLTHAQTFFRGVMKIWLKGYFHAHVSARKNLYLSEFHLINHANSLWPKLGDGKCGFLVARAPRKAGETTSG